MAADPRFTELAGGLQVSSPSSACLSFLGTGPRSASQGRGSACLQLAQRVQPPACPRPNCRPQVHGRTKTLFSTLKKLLRLGNTAAGGRARGQLYDLMGLRAIVQPRADLPPEAAEAAAARACYVVRDAACALWARVEGRSKDYIAAPKPNGYQSLHATMR